MTILLYTLHILTSFFLILVVLLQQGKGADLSVFGGGNTMTAFGARGAASLLHKMTVIGFVLFIFTTLAIGVVQGGGSSSVMTGLEEEIGAEAAAQDDATTDPAAGEDATAGEPPAAEPAGVFEEAEPAAGETEAGGEASSEGAPAEGGAGGSSGG